MTDEELFSLLKSVKLPVSYMCFNEVIEPPYIVYFDTSSTIYGSDERNEIKVVEYQVELYSNTKDKKIMKIIDNLFSDNGIDYTLNESYIASERMYLSAYNLKFVYKIRGN